MSLPLVKFLPMTQTTTQKCPVTKSYSNGVISPMIAVVALLGRASNGITYGFVLSTSPGIKFK